MVDDGERYGFVVDVCERGVRIERPFAGRLRSRVVQLEMELPGTDELIWAQGEMCFDRVRPEKGNLVRTSGVRLVAAATRHLRMLRDYVMARREKITRALDELAGPDGDYFARASHLRG
jgi:hypothetical protein